MNLMGGSRAVVGETTYENEDGPIPFAFLARDMFLYRLVQSSLVCIGSFGELRCTHRVWASSPSAREDTESDEWELIEAAA